MLLACVVMTRREVVQFRVSEDEKARIWALARAAGVRPSEWVRWRALEGASGTSRERPAGELPRRESGPPAPPRAPEASTPGDGDYEREPFYE
jgi:hypothetical protein